MKLTFKNIIKGICFLSPLFLASCEKLTEINNNPNEAQTTHPQALLTKVEWSAFTTWRGTGPLYALKMIVQTDGENSNQIYSWQRGGFGQYSHLRNIVKMEEEAQRIGADSYQALAKFFRAYYFYNLTLTFGDIPYSEAGKGESAQIFTPKYDTQKDVFVGILKELEEASEILKKNSSFIDGDIIFKGDTKRWIKTINSFRLKVLLALSNKNSDLPFNVGNEFAKIYTNETIITAIDGSDDAQLVFLNQDGNRYPEFNSSGYGSAMYMDSTYVQLLQDLKDPRLFAVATQTRVGKEAGKAIDDFSSYEGGDPIIPYAKVNDKAVLGKLSKVHERYYRDATTEPLLIIGDAEVNFILAEAMVRGWIVGDAAVAYANGIRASFKFYENHAKGLGSYVNSAKVESYLAQPQVKLSEASSMEGKLQRIITQKYIRTFHQGGYDAYFDHLRTTYPLLRKASNVKTAYRWMYPQEEYNNNTEHVSAAIKRQFNGNDNINEKTWWLK